MIDSYVVIKFSDGSHDWVSCSAGEEYKTAKSMDAIVAKTCDTQRAAIKLVYQLNKKTKYQFVGTEWIDYNLQAENNYELD